jgi:membrane protein insertase Oxa1/YidC/SpoIIIJ
MRKLENSAIQRSPPGSSSRHRLLRLGKGSVFRPLYAGPQIQTTLEQLAKPKADGGIGAQGLPLVVDYGWLTIIAAPIFWCWKRSTSWSATGAGPSSC